MQPGDKMGDWVWDGKGYVSPEKYEQDRGKDIDDAIDTNDGVADRYDRDTRRGKKDVKRHRDAVEKAKEGRKMDDFKSRAMWQDMVESHPNDFTADDVRSLNNQGIISDRQLQQWYRDSGEGWES